MRKIILAALVLTLGALLFTKGLYVELAEMVIVVIASLTISVLIRKGLIKHGDEVSHSIVALIAFVIYWGFSLFDLIGDHFLYYLPKEGVFYDGRPLTLGEKINEFNDDLLVVSWFPPLLSLILSFALSKLSREKKNEKQV